mgnify:CR=1 FL=1
MAKELELLAPAGAPPVLKAVIGAGADAVYVGGSRFGARAYAPNFNEDELLWAINYVHLYGKKLYLTVNTLLKEQETGQLLEYLLPYYRQGVDAVIVQDFGVMHLIRQNFPDLPIHASTQMTVLSGHGARFLAQAGASRIVMARELSLEEIAEIKKDAKVELEAFVHGAICYCYSGQCLFSSMLGGRSGNRGRCAQPCRLPYEVFEGRAPLLDGQAYPLSPKDLCTVELLPQLAESGVYSFKIEGRMKQAEYAAGVVSVYRGYMDRYLAYGKEGYKVSPKDWKRLFDCGNRSGFTQACLKGQGGADMITFCKPCHEKKKDGGKEPLAMQKEPKIKINGRFVVTAGMPAKLTVSRGADSGIHVTVDGETPLPAEHKAVTAETLHKKLCKTGNTPFEFESLVIEVQDGLFLPVSSVNEIRRQALDELEGQCLKPYRRRGICQEAVRRREGSPHKPVGAPLCITASAQSQGQLSVLLETPFLSGIYIDSAMFGRNEILPRMQETYSKAKGLGKQVFYVLPAVFRRHTSVFYESILQKLPTDGFLVKSYDALGFLLSQGITPGRIRIDHNVYTWSNTARAAFLGYGICGDTVPAELNRREIRARNNEGSEMIVYGALPLMVSAHCVVRNIKGCSHDPCTITLKDRYGISFAVQNNCAECYNMIYNSRPLNLASVLPQLQSDGIVRYRLSFSTETKGQVRQALKLFGQIFLKGGKGATGDAVFSEYTYGHYKRGVE